MGDTVNIVSLATPGEEGLIKYKGKADRIIALDARTEKKFGFFIHYYSNVQCSERYHQPQ